MERRLGARRAKNLLDLRIVFRLAAAIALAVAAARAESASWPIKPVRIVVPSLPGGVIDVQARLLAESFRASTKQPFVVDNRAGAGTLIGTEAVVSSPPDGYTVLLNSANIAIIQTLYAKRTRFNAIRDLTPVSLVSSTVQVLIAHPSVPARSITELIALAKKKRGVLSQGINTPGSTSHLSAEMLNQFAGIETSMVPFRSGAAAMTSLLAGEIDLMFQSAPLVLMHTASGKVRPLAVTSAKRSPLFPDLPTMNTFFPKFESGNWYAMFYPANTPRFIVDMTNKMIVQALQEERMHEFMKNNAVDGIGSSPEELAKYLEGQVATYADVIRKGNINLQ